MTRSQRELMNPYKSTVLSTNRCSMTMPGWIGWGLVVYPILAALSPLPLIWWFGENEPFMVPELLGTALCCFSSTLGVGWICWGSMLFYAVKRRWYHPIAICNLIFAVLFGGLSFFGAYLYLADPAGCQLFDGFSR
jgi:hypothetical protein